MDIQHKDNGEKGIFYVAVDGKTEAEMTYVWSGEKRIIIDHTGVSESLKGQSIGKQLVQAAVVFAREKQLKILPLCPFAKAPKRYLTKRLIIRMCSFSNRNYVNSPKHP